MKEIIKKLKESNSELKERCLHEWWKADSKSDKTISASDFSEGFLAGAKWMENKINSLANES